MTDMSITVPVRVRNASLTLFFVLAYAISWVIEVPLALQAQGLIDTPIPFTAHYLAAFGPMLAAFIVTGFTHGRGGLGELAGRMARWRVGQVWWLAALTPLVLSTLIAVILRLVQGGWPNVGALGRLDFLPNLGISALLWWTLTFGLGEETGWRGYALPRLQRDHSALSATLIVWIFWAGWHLPMFFYLYDATIIAGFLLGLLAGAITFTWLYNSTGGSILLVALFHGSFNFVTACIACKAGVEAAIVSALVMVWAVVVVLWFKPATLSQADKQML